MNIFSEINGAYFRTAAKLLEIRSRSITDSDIYTAVKKYAFRDSVLFLPAKLIPSKNNSDWGLLKKEKDGYSPVTANPPPCILTAIQKAWLKAILADPAIKLFLTDDEYAGLWERLSDITPLYRNEHFRFFDRSTDGDPCGSPEYIKYFQTVLAGIKRGQALRIKYISGKNTEKEAVLLPLKIEYSPKNDKFRLLGRNADHGRLGNGIIINIGRIVSAVPLKKYFKEAADPQTTEKIFKMRRAAAPVTVLVHNERNAPERFLMEFASYEKHIECDTESGELTAEIYYDRNDETELLIMLLSFGAAVEIVSPEDFRSKAAYRVRKQAELLTHVDRQKN